MNITSMPAVERDAAALEHLDFCGALSCHDGGTPEFPAAICTLPSGHEGMHAEVGVCMWEMPA